MADHIHTPLDVHRVRSLQEYREAQLAWILQSRRGLPSSFWRDPWVATDPVTVVVDSGAWKVACVTPSCGNYPVLCPSGGVALCFNCGAVYEGVAMPADYAEIAEKLLKRPFNLRYWTTETLEEIDAINAQLGVS